ncbi:MAG: carbohydrate ABC transporter permease [Eisenbergiella sp.]
MSVSKMISIRQYNKRRSIVSDRTIRILVIVVLLLITGIILYPLYFVLIASISDPNYVNAGKVLLLPRAITFDGYKRVFSYTQIWRAYLNTIIYLILGTFISTFMTLSAGYALSRKDLKFRSFIMVIFTLTMFFNGGMIPRYLLVKNLGLTDTIWCMVLPNAVSIWNLIIARTFFSSSLPVDLLEAAKIDGCNDIKFFFKIALPLSSALTMVMVLFYGVGIWNSYFDAMIFLKSQKLQPLQLIMRDILIVNRTSNQMISDVSEQVARQKAGELLKYVIIIISSAPLLIVYPFLQKYFESGIMVGAIKE